MAGGIRDWSTTPANNSGVTPFFWPEGQPPSSVNDCARQNLADIRTWYESAEWIDLGHTPTRIDNDTVTLAGDVTATYNVGRRVRFVGATTGYATISASSYSAPNTTLDVTMDSGNVPSSLTTISVGIHTTTNNAIPALEVGKISTVGDARYMKQGLATIPVLAAAMQAATTNGAASGTVETATNKVLYRTLDFDTTTQEFAGFVIPMPKSWNNGTVTFQPIWTFASSSGGVVWALQGVACSDDDAGDVAYGTEQTSTDTALTAGDVHVGPTSAAITIAGTPATGDLIFFRVKRVPADGSDTLGADARLIAIRLFFTQNAADDT